MHEGTCDPLSAKLVPIRLFSLSAFRYCRKLPGANGIRRISRHLTSHDFAWTTNAECSGSSDAVSDQSADAISRPGGKGVARCLGRFHEFNRDRLSGK